MNLKMLFWKKRKSANIKSQNKFRHDLLSLLDRSDEKTKKNLLINKYERYFSDISLKLYEKLEQDDQERFLVWFSKRWGDIHLINPLEYESYLDMVNKVKNQSCERVNIENHTYKIQDMNLQGYDFKLAAYDWVLSVHDVFYNQYEHKSFRVCKGDVIIDAGGFIGDTAALFCVKTSGDCTVHSFELLDENLKLFHFNNLLNGISKNVIVNQVALSNTSGDMVHIKQTQIQGATSIFGQSDSGKEITTITLDDYVLANKLNKIDFIKMDIEGAEMQALQGAVDTIKKFKPKLALCLYHKCNDVVTIPRFLDELNLDYKYYFKWVQLTHGWEAVLLAE